MNGRGRLTEFFVALCAAVAVVPVLLLALTAFKPETEVMALDSLWPHRWTLENFQRIFDTSEEIPIVRWFGNSLLISTATTLLVVTVSAMAAYALVRLRPRGSAALSAMIVGTMMVPGQIMLVPVYQILNRAGLIDTPLALIFPATASAFGVFLLSQFFRDIPLELEEAASMEGCGRWRIFWHVILPCARPALSTLAIFTFIGSWNGFMEPLVFLDSLSQFTLPAGIAIFQTSYSSEFGITFAASFLSTVPMLAAFLLFQRYIIRGVTLSGMK